MKRIVAFLLCFMTVLMCCMPILSATESDRENTAYPQLREHSMMYSCSYDPENAKVIVSGTVNHDVMITHSNFMIQLYRILPGETVETVMESQDEDPLASTAIAIKFQFSVSASRVEERFSRYAIVLVSPDGEKTLAAEPQYIGVDANDTYEAESRFSSFKGVLSEKTSIAGSLGFGTVVIPIYMDQAISKVSHGYLHLVGDTYHYFDQTYIDRLDAQIRTYSASGTRVYLQLLLHASESEMAMSDGIDRGSVYAMPNIFSENVLSLVCALSEFLALRYDQYQNGTMEGIIVGKQIDRQSMNDHGGLSLQGYAEQYAFYVAVVANSVRIHQPDLDIVIPLGNANVYTEKTVAIASGDCHPAELLESVLAILEERISVAMPCNVLIESSAVPFGISNQGIQEGVIDTNAVMQDVIYTETLQYFLEYMKNLRERYQAAPQHVMYVWTIPNNLSGKALECAYAYSYYRLLQDTEVSSFVISFEESEQTDNPHSMIEIKKTLQYINTDQSFEVTKGLLSYFKVDSWSRLIPDFEWKAPTYKSVYRSSVLQEPKRAWKGSFSYMSFESGDTTDWFAGSACKKINSFYGINGKRALSATMQKTQSDFYSEVICLYQYSENFVYTPMMKFTVAMTDTVGTSDSLYEVILTIGDEMSSLTSEHLVSGNSLTDLWVDMEKYSETHLAKYIKISVRMLHGEAEEYAFCLYDITGMSEEYSSEELLTLITAERMRIRNEALPDHQDDQNSDLILMVFGILLTITIVGVGLYMGIYRTQAKKSEKDSDHESAKKT